MIALSGASDATADEAPPAPAITTSTTSRRGACRSKMAATIARTQAALSDLRRRRAAGAVVTKTHHARHCQSRLEDALFLREFEAALALGHDPREVHAVYSKRPTPIPTHRLADLLDTIARTTPRPRQQVPQAVAQLPIVASAKAKSLFDNYGCIILLSNNPPIAMSIMASEVSILAS